MSTQELYHEAFAETFQDVVPMLKSIVSKHQKKHGGDFDELFSDAQFIFTDLYLTGDYDPNKGMTYSTWLYYKTWYKLIDMRKNSWKRRPSKLPEDLVDNRSDFPLLEWIESLPDDARILIRLILEHPTPWLQREAIKELKSGEDDAENTRGRIVRQWMRDHLLSQGWGGRRINEAFKMIRKALP